jgi:hypothetical protein
VGVGLGFGISSTSSRRTSSLQEGRIPERQARIERTSICPPASRLPRVRVRRRRPPIICSAVQLVLDTKTFMQPEYVHLIGKPNVCGDIVREPAHRRRGSHGLILDRPLRRPEIKYERRRFCSRSAYRIAKTTYIPKQLQGESHPCC